MVRGTDVVTKSERVFGSWREGVRARGDLGARVADFDWAATPLGAVDDWDEGLRQLVAVVLASPLPMAVYWGPELTVIYNQACLGLYGESRFASALGLPAAQVWPESPSVVGELRGVLETGAPVLAVNRLVWLDRAAAGEESYLTFGYAPIPASDGGVGGVLATVIETTELVLEREQAAQDAELGEAKSAFFAALSHELRTPLALVAAPIEQALEKRADLSAETRKGLTVARANVARLTRMVDALLDFSRLQAARVVPDLTRADVARLTRGLAANFAPAMERATLGFEIDVADLPRQVGIDQDMYERIVLNLLSNALKYTPSGSVRLVLRQDGADHYLVEVSDTGIGIAEADQGRVFERFERLQTPRGARVAGGAGIGLAMVRELTQLLGGAVSLESTPGVGSTFRVRLPFDPAPSERAGHSITPRGVESFVAEIEEWQPAAGRPRRRTQQRKPRLLLAEDAADLTEYLTDLLSESYEVVTVADGEAALAWLKVEPADLLLCDLRLPGLDGVEVVTQVRAVAALRDLPTVLLSSQADDETAARALLAGADDYIVKPFVPSDLKTRLAAKLNQARVRSVDAAWRRAVISSLEDGVLIFDSQGLVIDVNEAFTEILGYSLDDGPLRPPYPWWPTEAEDAEALQEIRQMYDRASQGSPASAEFLVFTKDRKPTWVRSTGATIPNPDTGQSVHVRTVRDVTRARAAQERRTAAAQVSADFSSIDDLATLMGVARHGLDLLFDGESTIQLDQSPILFSRGREVEWDELDEAVRRGLSGTPSPDTVSYRPGILLVASASTQCRAWVQFPKPRRIGPDEMIVADLLAQALALAVDRLISSQEAAEREAGLVQALASHRLIGQAVGILVERHRLLPGQAFDKLRRASQNRNLKLRDLAARVIETGADPENA